MRGLSRNLFAAFLALLSPALCIGKGKSKSAVSAWLLGQVLSAGPAGSLFYPFCSTYAIRLNSVHTRVPSIRRFYCYKRIYGGPSPLTGTHDHYPARRLSSAFPSRLSHTKHLGICRHEGIFSMVMIVLSLRYSFRGAYFTAFGVLHLPITLFNSVHR